MLQWAESFEKKCGIEVLQGFIGYVTSILMISDTTVLYIMRSFVRKRVTTNQIKKPQFYVFSFKSGSAVPH